MSDRTIVGIGMLLLVFSSLACNAFAGRAGGLPPPPNPTATTEAIVPVASPGPAPTVTLPGAAPVEEIRGNLRILVDLNIRSGPGVRFDRVGFLLEDARVTVLGRDPLSGWWLIQCPADADGSECWVSGGSQFTFLESTE